MGKKAGSTGVEDDTLLRACRDGDQQAWRTLIGRYRRLIHSVPVVAYRMSGEDAEEVFQRVVVKLFENIDRIRSSGSLPAWLVTVARNECRRHVRIARRWSSVEVEDDGLPALGDDPPDVVATLQAVDSEHRLALAFERLDEPSRVLLSALYLEDPAPSYAEIASRLGRPVGSLGPTRARSLKKLQRIYLDLGGRESDAEAFVQSGKIRQGIRLRPLQAGAL